MGSSSKENTPKFKFQPVRMCDMDFSMFGIHTSTKKNSARKNYAVPVRTCDMKFKFFEDEPSKKKPVRKQLWSDKKDCTKRLSTTMKPNRNTNRMTTYNKQLSAVKNLPIKQTEASSNLYTFKKPILQSGKKARKKLNLEVESSSKLQSPQELKVTVPKIVINKPITPERNTTKTENMNKRQSTNKNIPDLLDKIESSNQNIVDLFNKRFDELITKVESISNRLDKLELSNKYICKKCLSTPVTEEKIIEQTGKEKSTKSLMKEQLDSTCFIVNNQKKIDCPSESNIDQNTTSEINNLIDNVLSDITSLSNKNDENGKKVAVNPVKNKKNTFEMLEWKLQNESPMSAEFSLSDPDSPLININDINSLINDKDDFKSPLCKSLSTSSIFEKITKAGDTISKSYNDLDSVYKYNEIRKSISFLCTPKNTKTFSHLETPSVVNNHKKMISRKVQKQLLMLD